MENEDSDLLLYREPTLSLNLMKTNYVRINKIKQYWKYLHNSKKDLEQEEAL